MSSRRFARVGILLFCLIFVCLAQPICAAGAAGEVLYAARFSDYQTVRDTGLWLGTSSSRGAAVELTDGRLRFASANGEKAYLLLPDANVSADTYTVEFTFRFSEIKATNGYLGVILSSRGDAPRNRTELIFRADGSIDGYGDSRALADAVRSGELITVKIQVRYGFLFGFTVSCGDTVDTFTLSQLNSISWGGQGFVLRNAEVEIASVMLVNGTDYTELSGTYATQSYIAPEDWQPNFQSPETGDAGWIALAGTLAAAALAWRVCRRKV